MKSLLVTATSTLAGATMMATLAVPLAFAESVTVSGNGAGAHVDVNVKSSSSTEVYQGSTTLIVTNAVTTSDTGHNKIENSTGGSNSITTKDATSVTSVDVTGGSNVAVVHPCGCDTPETEIAVKGNGVWSHTKVTVDNSTSIKSKQKASAVVFSDLITKSKTGKNKIENPTGSGNTILAGEGYSVTALEVTSGSNILNPHHL